MEISHLSEFVKTRAEQLKTSFTLNGRRVTSFDIGSDTGMLPLVLMQVAESINLVSGSQIDTTQLVAPADSATHLLSNRVIGLPDLNEGLLHLHINNAIQSLARSPEKDLELPKNLAETGLLETSELSGHIARFPELTLSPMASPTPQSSFEPNK